LLARVLGAEAALARPALVSGTHAIVAALSAYVAPNGRLICALGRPYDTLWNALTQAEYSLAAAGASVEIVPLRASGAPDVPALLAACAAGDAPAAVFVQRSRGYSTRPSLGVAACAGLIAQLRARFPAALVLVDECYCELVEEGGALAAGADAVIGSLIKNLGGGLAPAGAYLAGKRAVVERVAARVFAPGLGLAVGPSLGLGRLFVQGLFQAPLAVGEALAGLDFAAALFAELGFPVDPQPGAERADIIQAVRLGSAEGLRAFAEGLQLALPVNARFRPEPGAVPGYADPVIMSSGSFVAGATLELSCDAPLREPFEMYLQGGLSAIHSVWGALGAAEALVSAGLVR
jgi:cystathionine beta-lyase family protein involved in aluminum resistance